MKYLGRISFVAILLFTLAGCKKFFDLKNPPQSPWTNVTEFERAAIGAYSRLFSNRSWSTSYIDYSLLTVSSADDVDWVNWPEWGYNRNPGSSFPLAEGIWAWNYQGIAACNDALDFVASHDGDPFPQQSDDDRRKNFDRLVGEFHFLRATSYYMLMNVFGTPYQPGGDNSQPTLPLITSFAKGTADAKDSKIGTVQEVFDQMIADLVKAKELLPERYEAGMHVSYQLGRANKFAAAAMLARTYFVMGDYQRAAEQASFVIDQNGGDYDLSQDPIEAWNKSSLDRGKEVIFWIPFYDPLGNIVPYNLTVLNSNAADWGQCGWVEPRMANSTIKRLGWMDDPFNNTGIKPAALRDKRFTQLMSVRYPESDTNPNHEHDSRPEIKDKTTIWNNKYYRGENGFNTNLPVIRLAEMYLTRAACRLKAGDAAGAAADLNVVKKRAWDTNAGGAFVPVTAANITQQQIDDDRLVEMFNEPDRIAYLRGLKVDIGPGDRNVSVEPYTSTKFIWVKPPSESLYR